MFQRTCNPILIPRSKVILASFPDHITSCLSNLAPSPSFTMPCTINICSFSSLSTLLVPCHSHSSEPGWSAHGGLHRGFIHCPPAGDPSQTQPGKSQPTHYIGFPAIVKWWHLTFIHMWQSHVEFEDYFAVYFDCIVALESCIAELSLKAGIICTS